MEISLWYNLLSFWYWIIVNKMKCSGISVILINDNTLSRQLNYFSFMLHISLVI